MRSSGIECVGRLPWGTHLCQFYESREDLAEMLVSYFRAGLENNEFCMWVASEPLPVQDALEAAAQSIPGFGGCLQRGQVEVIPYDRWYLRDGVFDLERVLQGWEERLDRALALGYEGVRVSGNTAWLQPGQWRDLVQYEEALDQAVAHKRMLVLCSYALGRCSGADVLDVLRNHRFAVVRRQGTWDLLESSAGKEAEEQLRWLSRAVEQSPATVVITDLQGRIEYVNPKFCRLTGYTVQEALGQNPRILKSGRMVEDEYRKLWETITSGREWRGEFLNKKKNGELYWESASISPIRDAQGAITHFLAVKEDITDRKQAEERIQKLNADLVQQTLELTAMNEELEAFSYSVSHDLRAPLRSIDGFSQALLEDYGDQLDAQGRDYLRRVRASTQRMAQLIDDILGLSRVTRSEMHQEPVDLSAVARSVVSELRVAQPERSVEVLIAPGLVAQGDPRLLRLALENLLRNAWKFTGKRPEARIELGRERHQEETVYFVSDNGIGFDMAYADKLFGPFQRLHAQSEFPGTGIGLATVQRIIHRHGGRLWAEAEVGRGATFYFTL